MVEVDRNELDNVLYLLRSTRSDVKDVLSDILNEALNALHKRGFKEVRLFLKEADKVSKTGILLNEVIERLEKVMEGDKK